MIQTTPIVVEMISSSNWPNWAFTGLSALAALAVALSTLAFHRWVRLQRRPRLQLIEGALELRSNQICAVEFAFANPGNVPIIVKSAAIAAYKGFRNYEVHIGKKLAVYPDPEQAADPNRRIHSRDVGHVRFIVERPDRAFPFLGERRARILTRERLGVIVSYMSGDSRREFILRKAWLTWPTDNKATILMPLTAELIRRRLRTWMRGFHIPEGKHR